MKSPEEKVPKPKGGKRPGAGRKPKDDPRRIYITINPLQKRNLYELTGEVRLQQAVQAYINMNL